MLYIQVAGLCIGIVHRYGYLPCLCKGYVVEERQPDFTVEITEADIEKENSQCGESHSLGYLEGLACYRKIAEKLSTSDGCLLHGVLMEMEGRGILICAHSGVGKSTHAMLWQSVFGKDKCRIINGDKPLLRKIDGKLYAWGTPWCGKEGISQNRCVEITDVGMIVRGDENKVTPLTAEQALPLLIDQLFIPNSEVMARLQVLDLANDLLNTARFHRIQCTPTKEAAITAKNAIFGA